MDPEVHATKSPDIGTDYELDINSDFQPIAKRIAKCQQQTAGTELDLSSLGLNELPLKLVSRFPGLKKLNLRNNSIESLPDEFNKLFPQLVALNLAENGLKSLPNHFGTLHHLQTLSLANNKLTELPNSFSRLHALEELNVSNNQLIVFDPEVGHQLIKLKKLQAANNQLEEIPAAFSSLTALNVVDLTGNHRLTSMSVPEKIRRLHERNVILHSRTKRRELITRALRVRRGVSQTMVLPTTDSSIQKPK